VRRIDRLGNRLGWDVVGLFAILAIIAAITTAPAGCRWHLARI
jgi:hypothetical protein